MKEKIISATKEKSSGKTADELLADQLMGYDIFSHFDYTILTGFTSILVKRALEK